MALSSDLAAVFSLIQQQQALEERKEERHEEMALRLLTLDIAEDRFNLELQSNLIDKQLIRAEKKYDTVFGELETSRQEFQDLTGQIYKVPEQDKSSGSIGVVNDIGGSVIDSLNQVLVETQRDTQSLKQAKVDISAQLGEAKLVSDFYTGIGHDYSAGDPEVWDIEDFSDEKLTEYMSQYPELADVDQRSFYEGMKTRGTANLLQNMSTLNTMLHQAKAAELSAGIKQIDYDVKSGNITVAQIEADIDNIDSGVHKMISSHAENLNSSLYAPSIQSVLEFTESKTPSNPEGDAELETEQNDQLKFVGSIVTGMDSTNPDWADENLRLGKLLVLSNSNYINSVKGYLKGSADLNYVGYVNGLQEIQMYAESARRALEDGSMSTEDYLAYKGRLEELVGTDLNTFNNDMGLLLQASDTVEDKGKEIAIAGMKESYNISEQELDYNIPDDYTPPPILPVTVDSSGVVIDSLNTIPDSTTVVPETTLPSIDTRPPRFDPKYAGWFSEGEPYYDPETDTWYAEQPLIDFAGGFLPIPNISMLQEERLPGQDPVPIEPIYNEDGELVGFKPPAFLSPSATTSVGEEDLKKFDEFLREYKEKNKD